MGSVAGGRRGRCVACRVREVFTSGERRTRVSVKSVQDRDAGAAARKSHVFFFFLCFSNDTRSTRVVYEYTQT